MSLSAELLALVRCPRCRGALTLRASGNELECNACKVVYPVTDGIPQLLTEEARPVEAR